MKKLGVAILLAFSIVSCEDSFPTPECLEVSLVTEICGHGVLKIENPMYYHLGEKWNEHQNVFLTFFNCEDMEKEKDGIFYVELRDEYENGGCAVCLALIDYQGEKKYPVKIMDACSEEIME